MLRRCWVLLQGGGDYPWRGEGDLLSCLDGEGGTIHGTCKHSLDGTSEWGEKNGTGVSQDEPKRNCGCDCPCSGARKRSLPEEMYNHLSLLRGSEPLAPMAAKTTMEQRW